MARRLLSHKVALFLAALALYFPASYYLADRFLPCHIATSREWEWEESPSPLLEQALDQEFHYLGAGSQCFVFESQDEKYVLKFFKHNRFRSIFSKKAALKGKKQEALLTSSQLAYTLLKDDSALLHLHLNKKNLLNKKVQFTDKLKRPFTLEVERYDFILQRKGELVVNSLNAEKVRAIAVLLKNCFNKGVGCSDFVIQKNVGFLDGKAFFIDTGAFFLNESLKDPHIQKIEAQKATAKFQSWLKVNYPELYPVFVNQL